MFGGGGGASGGGGVGWAGWLGWAGSGCSGGVSGGGGLGCGVSCMEWHSFKEDNPVATKELPVPLLLPPRRSLL
jgi:hypothetical protein